MGNNKRYIIPLLFAWSFFSPVSYANPLRAALQGATKSVYFAELNGIKSAYRQRSRSVTPSFAKSRTLQQQSIVSAPEAQRERTVSLNDLPLPSFESQAKSKDTLSSTEVELNSNGWQSF